jgi:hypothetical protein
MAARPTTRWPSPTEEPAQLLENLDQGVGVVVAGGDMEGQLGPTATDAVAERGRHRGLLPVERMGQGGRATTRRPGPPDVRGQAERGLVEEDQTGSAPLGVCLIAGHRSLTQRSMAAWSRSAARRLGRWTVQPSRWRSRPTPRPGGSGRRSAARSRWRCGQASKLPGEPVGGGAFQ